MAGEMIGEMTEEMAGEMAGTNSSRAKREGTRKGPIHRVRMRGQPREERAGKSAVRSKMDGCWSESLRRRKS